MILVFLLCIICIISILFLFAIILSSLHIKIEEFEWSNVHKDEGKINISKDKSKSIQKSKNKNISKNVPKYKIKIALYLFNKIKWVSIKLNPTKMRKMVKKMHLEKMNLKKVEQNIHIEDIKNLKKLRPTISLFKLDLKIGTEDVILTSFLVFLASMFISILLGYTIKEYRKNKYFYDIKPIYSSQNLYEIKFDGIIEIKMVHIINIIYIFIKRKRGEKNERTSNRRSYGYSYE